MRHHRRAIRVCSFAQRRQIRLTMDWKAFVRSVRMAGVRPEPNIGLPTVGAPNAGSPGFDGELAQRVHKANPPLVGSPAWHVPTIRKDFPILDQKVHGKPLVWFDNAATTQKPQSVIDAVSNFYAHDNSNIHRGAHTLAARATDAYEQARQKVQAFLGAGSAKEIIFVRGTTEGINLVTQTYGRKFLQPGDRDRALHAWSTTPISFPGQMVAKEKGAVLR